MSILSENWNALQNSFPILAGVLGNIVAAIAILIAGFTLAGWLRRRLRKSRFGGERIDPTIRPVMASAAFYLIGSMTLYAVLRELGVDAASLLAVFGAAGLAIGLALKDTLSNIASGVMMLVLRPLQIDDFIDTSSFSGTVQEVGLFATTLKNAQGVFVYVPNSSVWNARLTNFGRHSERKLTVDIGVGFETDLKTAQRVLLAVMTDNPAVQTTPSVPECYVTEFGQCAITLSCRCWLPAQDWMANSSDIRIAIKTALDKNSITIPYPQRVIINQP